MEQSPPRDGKAAWRPIPDFPHYEVSASGQVRRIGKSALKRLTRREKGRLVVSLHQSGKASTAYVNALVCAAFLGPRPARHFIAHRDGDLANCTLPNLEYRALGLELSSIPRPACAHKKTKGKLTLEQVHEIRRRLQGGAPGKLLAHEYGISPATVSQIKHRRKWSSNRDIASQPTGEAGGARDELREAEEYRPPIGIE